MPRPDRAPSTELEAERDEVLLGLIELRNKVAKSSQAKSTAAGRLRPGAAGEIDHQPTRPSTFPASEPQQQEFQMPTATAASKAAAPKPAPVPNGDFYQLVDLLTPEEKAIVKKVRTYMETKVQPVINKYWSDDAFPFELLPSFKELGLGGLGFEGYGCAGGSQKLFGFVAMELARTDASFCTFFGVHSGLAMGSIYLDGSEEQKQKWLPPMARLEKIGCFGLTEPLVGSGTSGGLTTTAKREGDTWILNGQKRWIGNAPWCDVSIIWARDLADNQVKGFIVENKIDARLQRREDRAQDRAQGGPERPDHAEGRAGAGGEPPAGRQFVPRYRTRAADDAIHGGLGVDRHPDGRIRGNRSNTPRSDCNSASRSLRSR